MNFQKVNIIICDDHFSIKKLEGKDKITCKLIFTAFITAFSWPSVAALRVCSELVNIKVYHVKLHKEMQKDLKG